jgi:inosine-uridine nucleoside N-ribohydrolase
MERVTKSPPGSRATLKPGAPRLTQELLRAAQLSPGSSEVHLVPVYARKNLPEKVATERAVFARLNALAEQQRSATGSQSYGAVRRPDGVPAAVPDSQRPSPSSSPPQRVVADRTELSVVIRRAVIFSGVARECRLEVSLRNTKRTLIVLLLCVFATSFSPLRIDAQQAVPQPSGKTKIILDTDIGDDVDDAFALALAMRSPEVEMVGITTAWGDTALRARLVQRFLKENGAAEIPIAVGIATKSTANFSQSRWAQDGLPFERKLDAVDFLLEQARKAPGEITLVAIGPLTNVGAAIERDAAMFKKFKRVVLMGGSIRKGYGDLGYVPDHGPQPEYNIYSDVAAAQRLFASGVPIFMMPLDSTQLMLDEVKRNILFSAGTAMTNSLAALYYQWVESNRTPTATLFDVMAVVYVVQPQLCPVTEFHITVDAQGFTRPGAGATNASACLASDSEKFFHFVLPRLTQSPRVAVNLRMSVREPQIPAQ